MANWCFNRVVFAGEAEAIEGVKRLFRQMAATAEEDNCGQLPDFIKEDKGYFFEICVDDSAYCGICRYKTKWTPNVSAVQAIARRYGLDFTLDYAETGCLIYGRASQKDDILSDVYLEDSDFEAYEYDEENQLWLFEGKSCESDSGILKVLLDRKINNQINLLK